MRINIESKLKSNSRIWYLFMASFVLTLPSAFAAHLKVFTRTVDLSLVQSGLIQYPENSVMKIYFETNNLPAQILTRALKLGIEAKYLDTFLVWISMSLSVVALSLPIYAFTKFLQLSLVISLIINNAPLGATFLGIPGLALWFFPWTGSSVYPDFRYYTSHTPGFLGLLIFLIVIGLLLNNVLTLSGFLAGLNIAVHPFYGVFSCLFWGIAFIGFAKNFKINQVANKFKFLVLGVFVSGFSLINTVGNQFVGSLPSQNEMDSYLRNWDSHRSNDLNLNWKAYFLFLIAFGVLQILGSRRLSLDSNLVSVVKIIQVFNIITILAYSYHVFGAQKLHQNIFMQAQVGRLQLTIGYLLTPLIFGVIIHRISCSRQSPPTWFWKQTRSVKSILLKEFTLICSVLAIVAVLYNLNDISKKNTTEFNAKSLGFECRTNLLGSYPMVLTSESSTIPIFRVCELPILLDATSFDFIPYLPQTLTGVKKIIEVGYGLDFDGSTNNINCGCIPESLHRNIWESRTEQEWSSIAQELKFTAIAAPDDWVIDISQSVTVLPGIKLYVLRS